MRLPHIFDWQLRTGMFLGLGCLIIHLRDFKFNLEFFLKEFESHLSQVDGGTVKNSCNSTHASR